MADARPPRFIKPLKPQTIPVEEVGIFEVVVESYPAASFQWFHDNVPIESTFVQSFTDNQSAVVIPSVELSHAGEYTVRAENVVGSVTSTASFNVIPEAFTEELVPPLFIKELVPISVMDGEEARLVCQVIATPAPRINWLHNGQPIEPNRDVILTQTEDGVCELKIKEVFPEDEGIYTCNATNKAGIASVSTNIAVESYEYVPDSEIATLPSVQDSSVEDLLSEGEDLEEGEAPHFYQRLPQQMEFPVGQRPAT